MPPLRYLFALLSPQPQWKGLFFCLNWPLANIFLSIKIWNVLVDCCCWRQRGEGSLKPLTQESRQLIITWIHKANYSLDKGREKSSRGLHQRKICLSFWKPWPPHAGYLLCTTNISFMNWAINRTWALGLLSLCHYQVYNPVWASHEWSFDCGLTWLTGVNGKSPVDGRLAVGVWHWGSCCLSEIKKIY